MARQIQLKPNAPAKGDANSRAHRFLQTQCRERMKSTKGSPDLIRHALFEMYIGAKNLPPQYDYDKFRVLCFRGIPDEYRAKSWKILSKILPFNNRLKWTEIEHASRDEYHLFFDQFVRDPTEPELRLLRKKKASVDKDSKASINSKDLASVPDLMSPLSMKQMFIDINMLEQIERDMKRTFTDLNFFQKPIAHNPDCPLYLPDSNLSKKRSSLWKWLRHSCIDDEHEVRKRNFDENHNQIIDTHWEAMQRVLYVYGKANPHIGYVQGMNHLLAPIYYVLANDPDKDGRSFAEADSFFMFTLIMTEVGDLFTRSFDDIKLTMESNLSLNDQVEPEHLNSESISEIDPDYENDDDLTSESDIKESHIDIIPNNGVGATMERLMEYLKKTDNELYQDMQEKHLDPLYFAFRWISVMFTQEFTFPDVLRLWDSMFTELHARPCLSPEKGFLDAIYDENTHSPVIDFLIQFSVAILVSLRDRIFNGDFTENMNILQNFEADVEVIFRTLNTLRTPKKSESLKFFDTFKEKTKNYQWHNPFKSSLSLSSKSLNSVAGSTPTIAHIPKSQNESFHSIDMQSAKGDSSLEQSQSLAMESVDMIENLN